MAGQKLQSLVLDKSVFNFIFYQFTVGCFSGTYYWTSLSLFLSVQMGLIMTTLQQTFSAK